jgi:hypothetical protein
VGGLFHVVTKVNNTWIALKDDPIKEDVLYVFNVSKELLSFITLTTWEFLI